MVCPTCNTFLGSKVLDYEKGKEVPTNLIISKLEKILNTKLPRIQKKVIE
jgi:ribosome-binding protein aMBF1 (putative translation factor)